MKYPGSPAAPLYQNEKRAQAGAFEILRSVGGFAHDSASARSGSKLTAKR